MGKSKDELQQDGAEVAQSGEPSDALAGVTEQASSVTTDTASSGAGATLADVGLATASNASDGESSMVSGAVSGAENASIQPGTAASQGDAVLAGASLAVTHSEATERFAGLHALISKIEGIEAAALERLRADLNELGTLLGLHTTASQRAQISGDYKASDLS